MLTRISFLIVTIRICYYSHTERAFCIVKMNGHQKQSIYNRVSTEFQVNIFQRQYYCEKLSLEDLKGKLLLRHPSCSFFVRFDHIVVKEENGGIVVYLFAPHSSGRCAGIHNLG